MDATRPTPRPRSARWLLFGLAFTGLVLPTVAAQAAPLRTFAAMRANDGFARATAAFSAGPTLPPAWNRFLSSPDAWATSRTPAFTLPVQRAIWRILGGDPTTIATNPMIDYLVWRRDLNPFRFDRYHPHLGPLIGQLVTPPLDPPTNIPVAPEVEPPITPLAPLTITPSVPEPSGLVLIGLVSAWGLWRRSQSAPRTE